MGKSRNVGEEVVKMNWSDVLLLDKRYLNLGGSNDCYVRPDYKYYVSVDIRRVKSEWSIQHDLRNPIPLIDDCVDRILTEDFLEHLKLKEIRSLLSECYRILKPKGMMRIGVPDYNNPKDYPYLAVKHDSRHSDHLTLFTYEFMKDIIEKSLFVNYKFYHYWDEGKFIRGDIDYSLGMIKRTPDNDLRCKTKGRELYATSIVVDLFKEEKQ